MDDSEDPFNQISEEVKVIESMEIDPIRTSKDKDKTILNYLGSVEVNDSDQNKFRCKLCNESISSLDYLKYHMKGHHEDGDWICNRCDHQTNNFPDFQKHVREFHLKLYCCKTCEYEGTTKSEIQAHMKKDHKDITYNCDLCKTEASSYDIFQSHIIKSHKDNMISCENCSFVSTSAINMENHGISQHKSIVYDCDKCQYKSDSYEESQTHLSKDHNTYKVIYNQSLFKCQQCPSNFNKEEDLKQHTEIHTYKVSFKCNKCDSIYADAEALNCHKQKEHKSYRPRRNFIAGSCKYGDSCLFNHEDTVEDNFVCYVCGDKFKEKQNLMSHRKCVHDNMPVCKNYLTNSCKFSTQSCWWKHEDNQLVAQKSSNQVFQLHTENLAPPAISNQQKVLETLEQLSVQMSQFKQILKGAGLLM